MMECRKLGFHKNEVCYPMVNLSMLQTTFGPKNCQAILNKYLLRIVTIAKHNEYQDILSECDV